jgi:hypothetical protein
MAVARAQGRLRGRRPKLSAKQQAELHASGAYSITDPASCSASPARRCTAPSNAVRDLQA